MTARLTAWASLRRARAGRRYLAPLALVLAGAWLWHAMVALPGAPFVLPGLRGLLGAEPAGDVYVQAQDARGGSFSVWSFRPGGWARRVLSGRHPPGPVAAIAGFAPDHRGGYYVAEFGVHTVLHVGPDSKWTHVAGVGDALPPPRLWSDPFRGKPAVTVPLRDPRDLAVSPAGDLYLADKWQGVSRIDARGIFSRAATPSFPLNGVPRPASAQITLEGLALSPLGDLYVFCGRNGMIWHVQRGGLGRLVAGQSALGWDARSLACDGRGNLYLAALLAPAQPAGWNAVWRMDPSGRWTRIAGGASRGVRPHEGALAATVKLAGSVDHVAVDGRGNVYFDERSGFPYDPVTVWRIGGHGELRRAASSRGRLHW